MNTHEHPTTTAGPECAPTMRWGSPAHLLGPALSAGCLTAILLVASLYSLSEITIAALILGGCASLLAGTLTATSNPLPPTFAPPPAWWDAAQIGAPPERTAARTASILVAASIGILPALPVLGTGLFAALAGMLILALTAIRVFLGIWVRRERQWARMTSDLDLFDLLRARWEQEARAG